MSDISVNTYGELLNGLLERSGHEPVNCNTYSRFYLEGDSVAFACDEIVNVRKAAGAAAASSAAAGADRAAAFRAERDAPDAKQ
jgi:hypothetical protein